MCSMKHRDAYVQDMRIQPSLDDWGVHSLSTAGHIDIGATLLLGIDGGSLNHRSTIFFQKVNKIPEKLSLHFVLKPSKWSHCAFHDMEFFREINLKAYCVLSTT